ncbi:MAG: hypothetical protein SCM11_18415 [Bacillota bacterium]|nr:hypothetical protein [Bacillota bacterium]
MEQKMKIGLSQLDITPPARIMLQGQAYTRISESLESPLMANVFAVEAAGTALVICACDVASVNSTFCNRVREQVRERCPDLASENIIISATHTHTGPVFWRAINPHFLAAKYLPPDVTFTEDVLIPDDVWQVDRCFTYMADKVSEAICTAWEKRRSAVLSPAFGRAVTGHCRRVVYDDDSAQMYGNVETVNFRELEGGNDSGIELLYIFAEDKTPLGALVNVACPSQCVESKLFISSDYWGKARDQIKDRLGDDFVVVGLCAAAGDQSPRDLIRRSRNRQRRTDADMNGLDGASELGGRIAAVVLDKLAEAQSAPIASDCLLRHEVLTVDFPLRRVTPAEREEAQKQIADYVAKNPKKVYNVRDMAALKLYSGILQRFDVQQQQQFYTAEIHVARLGDLAFATNPFELFLDFGNQIKALSDATQTFLIQLACDAGRYLPTEKAERGSHYSAYVFSGYTGHAGGELLVRKTVETIRKLWED